MAQLAQLTWALLLGGAALSFVRSSRTSALRPDALVAVIGTGLAAIACALLAASSPI